MSAITPDWVRLMARYNAWQNAGLVGHARSMSRDALEQDRGAFFGSILGTLNHLLWSDAMWMARFRDRQPPAGDIAGSTTFTPSGRKWAELRQELDADILDWATDLEEVDGMVCWHSGVLNREVAKPLDLLVTHFFNHQTHHRGQVHAMLTAAGVQTAMTDLAFMPDSE